MVRERSNEIEIDWGKVIFEKRLFPYEYSLILRLVTREIQIELPVTHRNCEIKNLQFKLNSTINRVQINNLSMKNIDYIMNLPQLPPIGS